MNRFSRTLKLINPSSNQSPTFRLALGIDQHWRGLATQEAKDVGRDTLEQIRDHRRIPHHFSRRDVLDDLQQRVALGLLLAHLFPHVGKVVERAAELELLAE